MDKKNKNQNTGNARATNHSDKKNPRKKTNGKTRPDRPADQKTTPDRKDHDPGRAPRRTKSNPLDELFSSEEFNADLAFIAECVKESADNDSQIGERASKWIGDHRYSRELNPERFAEQLKRKTGCKRSGRQINNYIDAYQERQLHEKSGKRFPYLDTSHLAQIASCCRDAPEEEHLELAELANRRKAGVREIPELALGLHAERHRTNRKIDVVATACKVRHMDGLVLLKEQADESVECLLADWPWSPDTWSDFVQPHTPDDPVDHLVKCLEVAARKLSPKGLILIHYRATPLLDPRIDEAIKKFDFVEAGEHIWQKSCGHFQNQHTILTNAHEKTLLFCRQGYVPKSCCGAVPSVSPKWGAPTRANSGQTAYHPHQKPVWLYETLIGVATVNGLVLDLYAGSGTAGIAAVRRGCPYVGAELVEHYVGVANERIALAGSEKEQFIEAVEFFLDGADSEARQAITNALEKSGLQLLTDQTGGES